MFQAGSAGQQLLRKSRRIHSVYNLERLLCLVSLKVKLLLYKVQRTPVRCADSAY